MIRNILLARDEFYFNNRWKSAFIEFQLQMGDYRLNNASSSSSSDFSSSSSSDFLSSSSSDFSSSSSSSSIESDLVKVDFYNNETLVIEDAITSFNTATGYYEIIYKSGLRSFDFYGSGFPEIDGTYNEIENKNYYEHVGITPGGTQITYRIFKDENSKVWYLSQVLPESTDETLITTDVYFKENFIEYGDIPIPPFRFESSNQLREQKPFIIWKTTSQDSSSSSATSASDYDDVTLATKMVVKIGNDSKEAYLNFIFDEFQSAGNADCIIDDITFNQQKIAMAYDNKKNNKHVFVNLADNAAISNNEADSSSSSSSECATVKRLVLRNDGSQDNNIADNYQDLIDDNGQTELITLDSLNFYSNYIKNGIIEINRKGDTIDYKLYEAVTKGAKKQLTFSTLNEDADNIDTSRQINSVKELHFNQFNDTDYKFVYNKEKMYWEIVSLLHYNPDANTNSFMDGLNSNCNSRSAEGSSTPSVSSSSDIINGSDILSSDSHVEVFTSSSLISEISSSDSLSSDSLSSDSLSNDFIIKHDTPLTLLHKKIML